jgi:ABC-2 type transport system permease protein
VVLLLAMPYSHTAMLLILTMFLVGIFYCMDALHGERRDRSILFWKSLPVSDRTTVLAKASIPLVILPLVAVVVTIGTQLILLVLESVSRLLRAGSAVELWSRLPLFQMELVLVYALMVMALWHAPVYAWLLLVSGWARRAVFLWVLLPPLAIVMFEKIAFNTTHFGSMVVNRLVGFAPAAFAFRTPEGGVIDPHLIPLTQLTPGNFLGTPGLWIGLGFTAAFLAAAVRLRRYREPI